jgi:hypothetical protein
MPAAVRQRMKAAAEHDRRSLNNLLVAFFKRGLELEDQEEGPG